MKTARGNKDDAGPVALVTTPVPGVCLVTLNRAQSLNALTGTDALELEKVFAKIHENDSVRCVVLTGSGRGFCAGADVSFPCYC